MTKKLSTAIALTAWLVVAGCSGSGGDLPAQREPGAANLMDAGFNQAAHDEAWQAILADPGAPGVDYDPSIILIQYKPGIKSPQSTAGGAGLPTEESAAAQPNGILRENKVYEGLTDAIAARFGLEIRQQAYIGETNLATFNLPEGVDGGAVIEGIRSGFAAQIVYATYDRLLRASLVPSDAFYSSSTSTSGDQWGHRRIGCSQAWDITNGDPGVTVAVCDTGVRISHFELSGQVLDPQVAFPGEQCDVVNNDNTVEDNNGHGTFIAGLMGAAANGQGMVGVAYGCRVIPIKIANADSATAGDMAAGCLLGMQLGAKSVNLSWGGTSPVPPLQTVANTMTNNGCLLVTAAGNDGTSNPDYPAAYTATCAVGASTKADAKTWFSNFGTYVDVAAPGEQLTSTAYTGDNLFMTNGEGTSFAAPLVAAAAGLLWSAAPSLTVAQVRSLLEDTGQPTTGFVNSGNAADPLLRLDLVAAFASLDKPFVNAPRPSKLVQKGTIPLSPVVTGSPDRVEMYFRGSLVQTITNAPYDFSLNTTSLSFGTGQVEFRAIKGGDISSAFLDLLVDNTTGTFPILEGFDQISSQFSPISLKGYSQTLLQGMIDLPASDWTTDKVDDMGAATWFKTGVGPQAGSGCMSFSDGNSTYDGYEADALVSKAINLPGTNPSLVFYHRYDIENGGSSQGFDRGYVLVSTDGGTSWAPADKKGGGTAFYSGTQSTYVKAEVNLAAFAGQKVNIAYVFESDDQVSGESGGVPDGWTVDSVVVATNYNTDVPEIGGVVIPSTVYGDVPASQEINVSVSNASKVSTVVYTLDFAPFGVQDLYDPVTAVSSGIGFPGTITIPTLPKMPNQLARLKVQYFDSLSNAGPEWDVMVYIFNLAGDVNADNIVDQLDLDAFPAKLGLTSADAGFSPFYDSDLDGVITEADASAVGYFWGESI